MAGPHSVLQGIWERLMSPGERTGGARLAILPDDVFLVSYPRSGNTWMRYLLANLLQPTRDWHISNIGAVVPDIYEGIPRDCLESRPRILKSHEPFREEYPRVIYLYRDGRDVSASLYDFYTKLRGYQKEFRSFLIDMLAGELPYGAWQDHVSSWLFCDRETPVLGVSYEELCDDTQGAMGVVGTYLGFGWSTNEIESAIAESTLEKQRADFRHYRRETHWSKGFRGGIRGAPGKWREVFNEDLNELFWEYAGSVAERLGYSKAT